MSNKSISAKFSVVTIIGFCLMLASVLMYVFSGIVIFIALPLFRLGSAISGISMLNKRADRSGLRWLTLCWSLIVLSVLPIVLVSLYFNNWVAP